MPAFDFFALYRFLLSLFVTVYMAVRFISFLRRWLFAPLDEHWARMVRRYVVMLLVKTPVRGLVWQLAQIAGLAVILVLLLMAHA